MPQIAQIPAICSACFRAAPHGVETCSYCGGAAIPDPPPDLAVVALDAGDKGTVRAALRCARLRAARLAKLEIAATDMRDALREIRNSADDSIISRGVL